MPFPSSDVIALISQFLNDNYGSNYFIWNISEESYDITYFNKQVFFLFEIYQILKKRFPKIVLTVIQIPLCIKFSLYVFL